MSNSYHSFYPYEKMSRSVFKSMRKDLSQKELSRRMGYSFNQWHKFESGQKMIMWSDFYRACVKLEIPIENYFKEIVTKEIVAEDNHFQLENGGKVVHFLWQQFGNFDDHHVRDYLKLSKSKWYRILSGLQDVELSLFLRIIGDYSTTLPFFLELICENYLEAKLEKEVIRTREFVKFQANNPFLCVIESSLETKAYLKLEEHDDQFLADMIGVTKKDIRRALVLLTRNGSVGIFDKKYCLIYRRVDMNTSIEDAAKFSHYWTQLCAKRFETDDGVPTSRRGWAYRVFPASKEAQDEIRKEIAEFIGRVNNIIINDQIDEREFVQVLMLHFFDHHEISSMLKNHTIPNREK